jgi:hypothetical protein
MYITARWTPLYRLLIHSLATSWTLQKRRFGVRYSGCRIRMGAAAPLLFTIPHYVPPPHPRPIGIVSPEPRPPFVLPSPHITPPPPPTHPTSSRLFLNLLPSVFVLFLINVFVTVICNPKGGWRGGTFLLFVLFPLPSSLPI